MHARILCLAAALSAAALAAPPAAAAQRTFVASFGKAEAPLTVVETNQDDSLLGKLGPRQA